MKKIIAIVLLVLAIAGISALATWTEGFTAWDLKELNEENLVNVANYDATFDTADYDDLDIEVDEDGVITIEGENKGAEDLKIKVATVSLTKGEYTISSGAKGTDDKTYYMSIIIGDKEIIADDGEDSTFKVETEDTFDIYITVCDGEEIDTTLKPVVVEGDKAGSFYVIG